MFKNTVSNILYVIFRLIILFNLCYRVGRASYVKQAKYLQNVDAGAYAVVTCVNAVTDVIKTFYSS